VVFSHGYLKQALLNLGKGKESLEYNFLKVGVITSLLYPLKSLFYLSPPFPWLPTDLG
jgi:hypothetical protein